MPQVITVIHRYPRKRHTASVWIVEGAGVVTSIEANDYIRREAIQHIYCVHPETDREAAYAIADGWRIVLESEKGLEVIERLKKLGL